MIKLLLGVGAILLTAAPSAAATYLFEAKGWIGVPNSVDRNFKEVPTPPTMLSAGDSFWVRFFFDTKSAGVTSLYEPDPRINIYYGAVSGYQAKIGRYVDRAPHSASHFASFQLWNDFEVDSVGAVDSFSLSVVRQLPDGGSPVDLGSGQINTVFGFNAFDHSAMARSSDSIDEITPLGGFSSQSAFVGFINSGTYLQTVFSIAGLSADVTRVPEPASWALMIAGFGLVGRSLRRRGSSGRMFVGFDKVTAA